MIDKSSSWDEFMLKKYEEAWTYIRYTYDVSYRILGYSFSIITALGIIVGRILITGDGIQNPIEIRTPSSMGNDEIYLLGFLFTALFLAGLIIQIYYMAQRVIIDRQLRVIDHVRQYFIDQAKNRVNLEQYMYLRVRSIPTGSGDIIAQSRLALPTIINSITGTLSFVTLFRVNWSNIRPIFTIFLALEIFQIIFINQLGYKWLVKQVAPIVKFKEG